MPTCAFALCPLCKSYVLVVAVLYLTCTWGCIHTVAHFKYTHITNQMAGTHLDICLSCHPVNWRCVFSYTTCAPKCVLSYTICAPRCVQLHHLCSKLYVQLLHLCSKIYVQLHHLCSKMYVQLRCCKLYVQLHQVHQVWLKQVLLFLIYWKNNAWPVPHMWVL